MNATVINRENLTPGTKQALAGVLTYPNPEDRGHQLAILNQQAKKLREELDILLPVEGTRRDQLAATLKETDRLIAALNHPYAHLPIMSPTILSEQRKDGKPVFALFNAFGPGIFWLQAKTDRFGLDGDTFAWNKVKRAEREKVVRFQTSILILRGIIATSVVGFFLLLFLASSTPIKLIPIATALTSWITLKVMIWSNDMLWRKAQIEAEAAMLDGSLCKYYNPVLEKMLVDAKKQVREIRYADLTLNLSASYGGIIPEPIRQLAQEHTRHFDTIYLICEVPEDGLGAWVQEEIVEMRPVHLDPILAGYDKKSDYFFVIGAWGVTLAEDEAMAQKTI